MPSLARFIARPTVLAACLASLIFVVVLAAPAPAKAACAGASAHLSRSTDERLERSVLCLLNEQRARRGLRRLKMSRRLSVAAARHSRDMSRRNYFSHTSRGGASFLSRIRRTGYLRSARKWRAGENIAWGSGGYGTPGSVVRAWMNSPGHRRNILGSFRHIGIGVAHGAPSGHYPDAATWTTDFGWK